MTEQNTTEQTLQFDVMQIMEMIPHRYPFLLVDRITECVPGKYSKGYKNLTFNEPFLPTSLSSRGTSLTIRLCRVCCKQKLLHSLVQEF